MRALLAAICIFAISGCMTTGPSREEIAYHASIDDGRKACANKFPFGMARTKCVNDVLEQYARPKYPFPDLLTVIETTAIAIAEKYETRQISEAEARAQLAKMMADNQSEFARRQSQQASLDMQRAALIQSSMPVTCIPGPVVNCF